MNESSGFVALVVGLASLAFAVYGAGLIAFVRQARRVASGSPERAEIVARRCPTCGRLYVPR